MFRFFFRTGKSHDLTQLFLDTPLGDRRIITTNNPTNPDGEGKGQGDVHAWCILNSVSRAQNSSRTREMSLKSWEDYGKKWGDMGGYEEKWRDMGRVGEIGTEMGKDGEIWGDTGSDGEI
ncbi:hypothetical protein RRG08_015988 [Elysia crispata]|uniref:Uncharacterized protein n=1 Tax=Elysia crispata TaxID=231223 RepID=A0AAE0YD75_9GAST|nr:hypothetical protein RRG08_015988 [Elysia crispata]